MTVYHTVVLMLAYLIFTALLSLSTTAKPVTMTVRPMMAMAPTNLHIELRVPRDPENRVLSVSTDGPEFVRSSAWEVQGLAAPYLFVVDWFALPAGEYPIEADLWSATALRYRTTTTVQVMP